MQIVLLLDHDAPDVVQCAWTKFKQWIALDDTNRQRYFFDISNHCHLEINNAMVVLKREESGLGDQQDNVGRQIRLASNTDYFGRYGSLCFTLSDDRYKRWSHEHILDMVESIIDTTNAHLKKSTTDDDNGLSCYKIEQYDIY